MCQGKAIDVLLCKLTANNVYDNFEFAYDVDGKCIDPYVLKGYGGETANS